MEDIQHDNKPHRLLQIYICGGHSVGKTRLSEEIIKLYPQLHYINEVGRTALKVMNISRDDLKDIKIRQDYQKKVCIFIL